MRLIDYHEASGEGLPYYAAVLKSKPYVYGSHWAPHDIAVRELGSGRSRLETALTLGMRFQVCPNLPLEDGIHAARMLLPRCWFDATKTKAGLEALQHYRRDWNSRLNEFKAVPVHDWSSHACVAGETLVLTESGLQRIDHIVAGDKVWTPCGYAEVVAAGAVKRATEIVEIETSAGILRCTPEHKLLTGRGFVCADALRYNDRVFGGHEWSLVLSSWISRAIGTGFRATITGETIGAKPGRPISIGRFTRTITALFQRATTFITAMGIPSTTTYQTSTAYPAGFTNSGIHGSELRWDFSSRPAEWHSRSRPSGTEAQKDRRGIDSTDPRPGRIVSGIRAYVRTAGSRFCRRILRGPSGAILIARWRRYDVHEASPWVYDLTVENHACYQANGILVSNSDAFRYFAVRQQPPKPKRDDPWKSYRSYGPGEGGTAWMS